MPAPLSAVSSVSAMSSIGRNAFYNCGSLTEINIPDSVTSIGDRAFAHCQSLTEIHVSKENQIFRVIDGVLFSKNDKYLLCYPCGLTADHYDIPQCVETIGDGAFFYCTRLKSISIPENVTSIGDGTFLNCTSLTTISIPDSVTNIGDWAFENCTNLTTLNIPDSVTSIGEGAFWGSISLTEINIPDSVTSIGDYAFNGCTSLVEINIPDSVTSIGACAFKGCISLTEINIPDSVTNIGATISDTAFSDCTNLTNVTVSKGSFAQQYCIEHALPYTYTVPSANEDINVGNEIQFGHYPQSSHGQILPIKWRVLEVKEDRALLLAQNILDVQTFAGEDGDLFWGNSHLRSWLEEEFIPRAFSPVEADRIYQPENPGYQDFDRILWEQLGADDAVEHVHDSVFVLSYADILNYFPGENSLLCPGAYAQPTEWVEEQQNTNDLCWWLKSASAKSGIVYVVSPADTVGISFPTQENPQGVRPALWLKINNK